MASLRFRLFGQFSAERGHQPLEALHAPRVLELLCFLLLHRHGGHSREALAGRLWQDDATGTARKSLRQALWQLQRILDAGAVDGMSPILVARGETISLNDAADLWLDTAVLEQAEAVVRGTPGARLDAAQARFLQEAIALYRGDLLDGWYQDWCLLERERLQDIYLMLLNKLMGYCEAAGRYEEGLEYGARILRVDRARERAHWRLMRLHYLLGDRTAALRQYQRCVTALREDLGVAPAARMQTLYQQIRADQMGSGGRRRGPAGASDVRPRRLRRDAGAAATL